MNRLAEVLGVRAKLDLELDLEQDPAGLHPGDTVSGEVTVRPREEVACDALVVELQWHTHGRDSSTGPWIDDQRVYEGVFEEGIARTFPFSLTLPADGPLSYRGRHLNIDWRVRARAEVPRSMDPKLDVALVVTRSSQSERAPTPPVVVAPEPPPAGSRWPFRLRPNRFFIGLVVLYMAALAMNHVFGLVGGIIDLVQGQATPSQVSQRLGPLAMMVLMALGALGLSLLLPSVRNAIAKRRLGPVTVDIRPFSLRPGEFSRVGVRFTPLVPIDLSGVRARLEARETVTTGTGTNRTTYRHVDVHHEVVLSDARRVGSRMPLHTEGELGLRADAPPSFAFDDQSLSWHVVVTVELGRWPDWTEEKVMTVEV